MIQMFKQAHLYHLIGIQILCLLSATFFKIITVHFRASISIFFKILIWKNEEHIDVIDCLNNNQSFGWGYSYYGGQSQDFGE
ncbi:unnamed protein product [Brugia pahangi]|uniref:Pept_C1 domain-containing protein n=1 Tax=Brugia pahangi TaxID=6280 RepID=A0A0N4TGQ2_BRUPA|nr:unnamed protein product [Brugia pahangi]